jgi:hypothetical protein
LKRFIFKIFKFFLIASILQFLIVTSSLILVNQLNLTKRLTQENKLISKNQVLVCGNSHPECAINDSLLPMHIVNISNSGEHLFYTCNNLQDILQQTHNKILIIEFTNNSLTTASWLFSDQFFYLNFKKNLSSLKLMDHFIFMKMNPLKYLKSIFSITPDQIYSSNVNITGGYRYLNKTKTKIKKEKKEVKLFSLKTENIGYQRLNCLIQNNKSTLFILIRTPMHRDYQGRKNEDAFQTSLSQLRKNKNCRMIDFDKLYLDDKYFADNEHLNFKGARIFTPIFYDSIKIHLN